MNAADKLIAFLESLKVPEGRGAGDDIKLAPFQKRFLNGVFAPGTETGALSVARGGGKTMLTAGVSLAELLGVLDDQPRREVICTARTQQQAAIIWDYVRGLADSLDEETQEMLTFTRAPYTQIRYAGDGGGHVIKCLSATPKNALGLSPTLCVLDERGSWDDANGAAMEAAIMSATGKRGARTIMISTSAPDDAHAFSHWLDDEQEGVYRQEHRAPDGLAADDREGILAANPGAEHGVGPTVAWLEKQARRAIARGGSTLAAYRNLNLNQRVSSESRDVLLTTDQWLALETDKLPPRKGPCVLGLDLGGSASMSAAALYWPQTERLECVGAFPNNPKLAERGEADGVGDRYVRMEQRGELVTYGNNVVNVPQFLGHVMQQLNGEQPEVLLCDRYRKAELDEALTAAELRIPAVLRGQGWQDSGEDTERFRQAAMDGHIKVNESLLLRSAMAETIVQTDPAGNQKAVKGRSKGRVDAAMASVLAIAEGRRRAARPRKARAAMWA